MQNKRLILIRLTDYTDYTDYTDFLKVGGPI
jgi:hypothetical protein